MRLHALMILLLASTVCTAGQVYISGGSVLELPDGTQLAFDISSPVETKTFILNNPPRFVIDINNARFASPERIQHLRSADVRAVRTGIRDGRNLRIVLDLDDFVRSKISMVNKNGHHLVVDVFRHDKLNPLAERVDIVSGKPMQMASAPPLNFVSFDLRQAPASEPEMKPVLTKPVIKNVVKPLPEPQVSAPITKQAPVRPEAKPVKAQPEPVKAQPEPVKAQPEPVKAQPEPVKAQPEPVKAQPEPVKVRPEPAKVQLKAKPIPARYRDLIIAIDPGHGGKDPGALGRRGTPEKRIVLQIARRLKALIDKKPGMRAILTRNNDKYLHLYQRIAIARRHKADMFISIHADAFNNPHARGSSVFMLSTQGASSAAARWLAEQENQVDSIGGTLGVIDKDLTPVVFDIVHDAVLADSMDLGGKVLRQLRQVNRLHKRKVERAGFAVLKAPDMPSILVETAFISNPKEEANLLDSDYQNKLAKAIMEGVRAYFDERPQQQPRQLIAALSEQGERVHVIQRGESLSAIAERYQVSVAELRSANGLDRGGQDRILAGSSLTIPGGS